jgi:cell division protein FtsB
VETTERTIMSQEEQEHEGPALQRDLLALKKRVAALEARVTELEKELRETQEAAPAD